MKVSLNWLKEFTKIELSIDDLVEKIGSQLGAIEQVNNLSEQYKGIIVAKVIDSQPHPNAEKLHVCKIDDGNKVKDVDRDENGFIQVICGASNVRENLTVVFIPPGATVPDTFNREPLVISVREIRGIKSNGMLASYRELALSNDHEGIVELDSDDAKPGDDFASKFNLNDYIINIENKMFTHRPDCFGHIGIAREITGIYHQSFTSPEWYLQPSQLSVEKGEDLPLNVENKLPDLVPRFMVVALTVKDNGSSPIWLQSCLSRIGVRPVNTIVDITNYMMCATGQPLHAYDYDKLRNQDEDNSNIANLIVRSPKDGEQIIALNGKTYLPSQQAIGIASATKLVGIGGVIGGAETEVDETTKRIVLECANFDMNSIRRTAMDNGIFTDAVMCYTKGQSPLQNNRVLNETINMFGRLLDAKLCSKIIDLVSPNVPIEADTIHPPQIINLELINQRLGLELSKSDAINLLRNVEFAINELEDKTFQVTTPFWRTDIEITEDIIEEIGRLWGYDSLPLILPKRDLKPVTINSLLHTKSSIRNLLSAAGANELLTYSFVHGNLMKKVGQDTERAFQLQNAISPDLQYYRLSILPGLLEKVYPNIRAGNKEFVIFELNPVHTNKLIDNTDNLPIECQHLGLIVTADNKYADLNYHGAAYYQAKKYLQYLLDSFNIKVSFEKLVPSNQDLTSITDTQSLFEPSRSAVIKSDENETIGVVGEFKNSVRNNLKLPNYIAGFEIDISRLSNIQARQVVYRSLSRFPSIQHDICLRVADTVAYAEVYEAINTALVNNQDSSLWYEVTPVDIYQSSDKGDVKQITFHITIGSYQRTLTENVAETILDDIAKAANQACGAQRI
jgi:phenylalanyl-tRNA synthetase beta chain